MRQQNKLIMGIGHRIKSLSNPDMRVTIIKDYALKHFKNNKVLEFAMAVEQVMTFSANIYIADMATGGRFRLCPYTSAGTYKACTVGDFGVLCATKT